MGGSPGGTGGLHVFIVLQLGVGLSELYAFPVPTVSSVRARTMLRPG